MHLSFKNPAIWAAVL